ncbi:unnamed protein product [Adineta steineri]|uniref:Uncharacterized protein n=1 Tax=Adineta steineri TaxID=433720 RepID=A0A814ZC62_9BILA|nr:unnamed protein product [Adineta steineri]CAF1528694.1 unnamed protein product [Adineta steineri]
MQLSTIIVFVSHTIFCVCADYSSKYTNDNVLMRMMFQTRDNHGCDAIIPSCGPKGRCCDWHDECFKRYGCRANSWGWSWIPGVALFEPCARCNKAVLFCIGNIFTWPGPSECCGNGNCGQNRPRKYHSRKIIV